MQRMSYRRAEELVAMIGSPKSEFHGRPPWEIPGISLWDLRLAEHCLASAPDILGIDAERRLILRAAADQWSAHLKDGESHHQNDGSTPVMVIGP